MGSPSSRSAAGLGIGLLVVTGIGVTWQAVIWNAGFFHDDAFITLRYAQNWIAGNGVAWNPGDRVEGYTNFLELLLASGLGALGADLVSAARAIGIVAWLGLAALAVRFGRGDAALSLLPAVATSASIPLIAWVFGGLEAPLLAVLLSLGVLGLRDALCEDAAAVRSAVVASGLAFGLAILTRPDAALFPAVGLCFLLLATPSRARLQRAVCFLAPMALIVVPWLAWKLVYYGALVPNTWWVKGSDPSAWRPARTTYLASRCCRRSRCSGWWPARSGRGGWGDSGAATPLG